MLLSVLVSLGENIVQLGLGRILNFTFEYSLIKCSNIRSFGVSFQVTGFLVLTNILLKFYLSSPI